MQKQSVPFINKNVTLEDNINDKQKTFYIDEKQPEKTKPVTIDKYNLEEPNLEPANDANHDDNFIASTVTPSFSDVDVYVDDDEEEDGMYDYMESLSVIEMVNGLLNNMLTEIKNEDQLHTKKVIIDSDYVQPELEPLPLAENTDIETN